VTGALALVAILVVYGARRRRHEARVSEACLRQIRSHEGQ
jgi:hypothetical protein